MNRTAALLGGIVLFGTISAHAQQCDPKKSDWRIVIGGDNSLIYAERCANVEVINEGPLIDATPGVLKLNLNKLCRAVLIEECMRLGIGTKQLRYWPESP